MHLVRVYIRYAMRFLLTPKIGFENWKGVGKQNKLEITIFVSFKNNFYFIISHKLKSKLENSHEEKLA